MIHPLTSLSEFVRAVQYVAYHVKRSGPHVSIFCLMKVWQTPPLLWQLIFILRNCLPVNSVTTEHSKLPFRLDNSKPRESQLHNEALVVKRAEVECGFQRSACITPLWLLYRTNLLFHIRCFTFRSADRVDFVSAGLFAQQSESLRLERRQVLPLIIETGKLTHSKVSSSSWGNDPLSSQVKLRAFQKLKFEEFFYFCSLSRVFRIFLSVLLLPHKKRKPKRKHSKIIVSIIIYYSILFLKISVQSIRFELICKKV